MIQEHSLSYFHCVVNGRVPVLGKRFYDFRSQPRPWYAIAYVVSGDGTFVSADRSDRVRSGDLIYIHKGARYYQEWAANERMCHIACQFVFTKPPEPIASRRLFVQKITGFEHTLPDFEFMYENFNSPSMHFDVMARFYRLLSDILPKLDGVPVPPSDPLIARAVEYIEANYNRPIRVSELAFLCRLSESHFYSRFHQAVGMSPIEYKNRAAIACAQRLLIEDPALSIGEISLQTGFESTSYFRRMFRKIIGLSPREYRSSEMDLLQK